MRRMTIDFRRQRDQWRSWVRMDADQWRSWVRMDAATGASEAMEITKPELARQLGLAMRDLRPLHPFDFCPPAILARDRAIMCNLPPMRCIITADEMFIPQYRSPEVAGYVAQVQHRLTDRAANLPFEFIALDVALEATYSNLESQTTELETEAYPLLHELAARISTINLQRVWNIKGRLVELTWKVQKVKDAIEQLTDHDADTAKCYLTEKKKRRIEASILDQHGLQGIGDNQSFSAPVSRVSSPPASGRLEKEISTARSKHDSLKSPDSNEYITEEMEMLLEDYLVYIDGTLRKLTTLKEYIDDTENFVNIQLDNVRNKLLKFELLLGTAAFVVAIFAVVPGVFGMNFEGVSLYNVRHGFEGTLAITSVCSLVIFGCLMWYLKRRMTFF